MVESAILRTVLYADIFHFALTIDELHRFLIHDEPVTMAELERTLYSSRQLAALLCVQDGCVALSSRAHIISLRHQRTEIAARLLRSGVHYGRILANLPFVRMVAITGAIAMQNPSGAHDDIDYLLVVQTGRVWLARALSILVVRYARLWGTKLCPNYVVAHDQLTQQRRDLYIAHEIAQMMPLYGHTLYEKMLALNAWAAHVLPNSKPYELKEADRRSRLKQTAEYVLGGRLGNLLDTLEYRRRAHKFRARAQAPESSAAIDRQQVKGHFIDHGQRILEQYHERLAAYDLS
jgi:hypothetical protein